MDDVALNKSAMIERAIGRVREIHQGDHGRLDDLTLQDAIVLNLQRACEAAIDLAMHLVRRERLGIPQTSREAFDAYQKLSRPILEAVIDHHLDPLLTFASWGLPRAA